MTYSEGYINDWTPEQRRQYTQEVVGRLIERKLRTDPDALKHGVFKWVQDENGNWVRPDER